VVALGNAANQALLGRGNSLGDTHGTINWSDRLNCHVMATYHPAAVLRSPGYYIDLVNDMRRAVNFLSEGVAKASTSAVEYVTLHNYDQVLELYERLQSLSTVVLDVETASTGELLCVGIGWRSDKVVVVTKSALNDPRVPKILNEALKDKNIIGHNLKYDIKRLWAAGMPDVRVGDDTMLMHYTLDERPGEHKLKPLVMRYLNVPDYDKAIQPYYKKMETCPEPLMWKYNACDVGYTHALHSVLARELGGDERFVLYNLLYPAANVLARMEYLGVMIDRQYLTDKHCELQDKADTLEQKMFTLVGKEFNPRSPKQLLQILYNDLGLPIPGGRMSTDEAALTMLVDFHPLCNKVLEYRKTLKLLRTYVDALLEAADSNDRVHTNFNLHGTVTGRLSSSDPVNLQNIPKDGGIRRAFIATPGYTMIEGDLSQAEVRVLAWFCKDPNLISALASGGDMHVRTASIMFRKRPEEVTPQMRQAAKRLTFGIIYGMSPESLAAEIGVTHTEAVELQDLFFGAFPRVKEWIRYQQQSVCTLGYVDTPFNRKRRFEFITPENKAEILRQAVNAPIQSTASDITLSALIRIGQRLGNSDGTRLLLTVHDSILLETREDPVEVAHWVKSEMVSDVLDNTVPFDADVKIGQNWGELKEVL